MGMFDTFVFSTPEPCRKCGTPMPDAQSKDSVRQLLVFHQGKPYDGQSDNDGGDWRWSHAVKLPDEFDIYTYCSKCRLWHDWKATAINGVWVSHTPNNESEEHLT